jgi:peptidoglycan hydrolase-like protein with peptidoglycan-binding domain
MNRKKLNEVRLKRTIKRVLIESFLFTGTVLTVGSTGEKVSELQKMLGIYEDGKFGRQTKKCVEAFQKEFKLDDTGVVDGETTKKIGELVDGSIEWDSPKYCKVTPYRFMSLYDSNEDEEGSDDITTTNKVTNNSGKHIIIGDSQTPFVDNASEKVSRISTTPGMSSLWQGGKSVSWLIKALESYPVDESVESVVLCIGTNGGFGRSMNDNIPKLIDLVKNRFPNSEIYAIQGSWGWGSLGDIKEKQVRDYYKKYENLGVTIVEPPIGKIEPHGNKPIYKVIGKNLDGLLD